MRPQYCPPFFPMKILKNSSPASIELCRCDHQEEPVYQTTMTSAGRVAKEIGAICKPDSSGVIAICAADDMRVPSNPGWRHLVGTITGPEGTPYEGGVFDVDILIPREYPFEPPRMKFITRIWHPNISSQTGAICLVSCDVDDDDLMAFRMSDAVGFLATIGSEENFCSESL